MNPEEQVPIQSADTFMGATKAQFLGAIVALLMLIFAVQGYQLYITSGLASKAAAQAGLERKLVHDGKEAHDALCVSKRGVERLIKQNRTFLGLTLTERTDKYGPLGAVPDKIIKRSIAVEEKQLRDLRSLSCP